MHHDDIQCRSERKFKNPVDGNFDFTTFVLVVVAGGGAAGGAAGIGTIVVVIQKILKYLWFDD